MNKKLIISDLSLVYDNKEDSRKILSSINFDLEESEIGCILGPSGCGKTSLLRAIAGFEDIISGSILKDGVCITNNLENTPVQDREMGMVFQGSALFDSMSVIENVMFPLTMLSNKNDEEIRQKAEIAIQRVELDKAHQKLPSELSGGMQKRVAIARAIVMNPKYLFCDEPNSGLDPRTSIIIDKLIQEITKEFNITTIINTHDMNSVMEIGEKILFLVDGEKEWEGSNKEIFKTNNQSISDFVYSSELLKKVRKFL